MVMEVLVVVMSVLKVVVKIVKKVNCKFGYVVCKVIMKVGGIDVVNIVVCLKGGVILLEGMVFD